MSTTKVKYEYCRINWSSIKNIDCINLINHGFHAHTIAEATGLTVNQVYYRARQVGVCLRDYRNGCGPIGTILIRKFTVKKMSEVEQKVLCNNVEPILNRRLEERKKRK